MHVVIGGAYCGKRQYVKSKWKQAQWISAYDGVQLDRLSSVTVESEIVLEGFEVWIAQLIDEGKSDEEIVHYFREQFARFSSSQQVILIMLEIGKGIVPMEEKNRRLRDIMGWIQQAAVQKAEGVTSIWHGLAREMK